MSAGFVGPFQRRHDAGGFAQGWGHSVQLCAGRDLAPFRQHAEFGWPCTLPSAFHSVFTVPQEPDLWDRISIDDGPFIV